MDMDQIESKANDSLLEDLKFNKKNNMQQIYDTIMSEVNIEGDTNS